MRYKTIWRKLMVAVYAGKSYIVYSYILTEFVRFTVIYTTRKDHFFRVLRLIPYKTYVCYKAFCQTEAFGLLTIVFVSSPSSTTAVRRSPKLHSCLQKFFWMPFELLFPPYCQAALHFKSDKKRKNNLSFWLCSISASCESGSNQIVILFFEKNLYFLWQKIFNFHCLFHKSFIANLKNACRFLS